MNKKRLSVLLPLAYKAITDCGIVNNGVIHDSYNGLIAGFGVMVATNGLLPAVVIYYQQKNDSRKTDRRVILEMIAVMMQEDGFSCNNMPITDASSLLSAVLSLQNKQDETKDKNKQSNVEKKLRTEVIECAIALKQMVRTYKSLKIDETSQKQY